MSNKDASAKIALTVDLEEWFTVQNFFDHFSREEWDSKELRSPDATLRLLDLFDKHNVKATFFILGWVAERAPEIVKEVAARGHEIASHGYGHEMVKKIGEERFREDLKKSLEAIHSIVECDVVGYRAPSFSIDPEMEWIFEALRDYGFKYDSSLFPVTFHPDYSVKSTNLTPFEIGSGITEFPMTCIPMFGKNLPCSGGGYFRLLPYQWFKFGYSKCIKEGRNAVFYLHPWEIDPDQPKVTEIALSKRIRHYTNLDKTFSRLDKLLSEFEFDTMRNILSL